MYTRIPFTVGQPSTRSDQSVMLSSSSLRPRNGVFSAPLSWNDRPRRGTRGMELLWSDTFSPLITCSSLRCICFSSWSFSSSVLTGRLGVIHYHRSVSHFSRQILVSTFFSAWCSDSSSSISLSSDVWLAAMFTIQGWKLEKHVNNEWTTLVSNDESLFTSWLYLSAVSMRHSKAWVMYFVSARPMDENIWDCLNSSPGWERGFRFRFHIWPMLGTRRGDGNERSISKSLCWVEVSTTTSEENGNSTWVPEKRKTQNREGIWR